MRRVPARKSRAEAVAISGSLPAVNIHRRPLGYEQRLPDRDPASIVLVVIHCTELPDLETAREYGERIHYPESRTGNAGHFYITRRGKTECWIDPARIAHHAAGFNDRSIGIELVNLGRYPNWYHSNSQTPRQPYTPSQTAALIGLLQHLKSLYPGLTLIAGHQDLDQREIPAEDDQSVMISRKIDPGPLFPWQQIQSAVYFTRICSALPLNRSRQGT